MPETNQPNQPNQQKQQEEQFLQTRSLLLTGEINKKTTEEFFRTMLLLRQKSDQPVHVYIDSPGGDADAGFALFDMIEAIDLPVYTIGCGLVASAAFLVMLAPQPERRLSFPHARYMSHQPLSQLNGVATDIDIHAKEIEKFKSKLNQVMAKKTGQDVNTITQDSDRNFWMDAQQALGYGVVHKIVDNWSLLKP